MAPYCINCGAPPLLRYRGRRAAKGPLCAWCIRQLILTDHRRSRLAPAYDDALRLDEGIHYATDRAVIIDLRFSTPALAGVHEDSVWGELSSGEGRVLDLDAVHVDAWSMNGSHVNGAPVNGADVHGADVHGADVKGAPANGAPVNGKPVNGKPVNGAPVRGSTASGTPDDDDPSAAPRRPRRTRPLRATT